MGIYMRLWNTSEGCMEYSAAAGFNQFFSAIDLFW